MSSVFYKFRNQVESQRVTFDGTGITVFELKRDIISLSKLGDGSDFDLILRNPDTDEAYDDDTTIIPRSTSVIAIRRPAAKPGQGRGARYVSGRMPTNAKNNYRKEQTSTPAVAASRPPPSTSRATAAMDNAKTEEERMKAMLEMGGAQWEQQQQQMSTAQRVNLPGMKNKNLNIPDHAPPPGYVCYRCGKKGHWIQQCPTNDDPDFENKPRIKRITGIPKAFLKTVEDPGKPKQDGLTDDAREPTSIMVDANGNRVVAVPDMAAWQQFQDKAKAAAANQDIAAQGSKDLQDRGLECPIDKRMFVDPVKTPCCGQTYCNECIDNALSNNDLVCPHCSTDNVLIDDLIPDDEINANIKAYEEEKKAEKKATQPKAESPSPTTEVNKDKEANSNTTTPAPTSSGKRKRSTDSTSPKDPNSTTDPIEPGAKRPNSSGSGTQTPTPAETKPLPPSTSDQDFVAQMNAMAQMQGGANGVNANGNNAMNMPNMMGMPNGMMNGMNPMINPMMMMDQYGNGGMMPGMPNGFPGMNGMNGMNGMGWPGMNGGRGGAGGGRQQNMNGGGQRGRGGWNNNRNFNQQQTHNQNNMPGLRGVPPTGPRRFQNQAPNQAEEAYLRRPVNPGRQQGRQKRVRQADYRELGS